MSDAQKKYQWVTTAPNPRSPASGWKLHAIIADGTDSFKSLKFHVALCGLRPSHGWWLDLFIEDECAKCLRAIEKLEAK